MAEPGPLTRTVLDYTRLIEALAPAARSSADWAPLAQYVAVDAFERVGTFLEVQNWEQYAEMLTQWAAAITKFETTARRISEMEDLVYYEIEERHFRGDTVHVVNSMTVFAFNDAGRINRLNVYLQHPR